MQLFSVDGEECEDELLTGVMRMLKVGGTAHLHPLQSFIVILSGRECVPGGQLLAALRVALSTSHTVLVSGENGPRPLTIRYTFAFLCVFVCPCVHTFAIWADTTPPRTICVGALCTGLRSGVSRSLAHA